MGESTGLLLMILQITRPLSPYQEPPYPNRRRHLSLLPLQSLLQPQSPLLRAIHPEIYLQGTSTVRISRPRLKLKRYLMLALQILTVSTLKATGCRASRSHRYR